MSEHAAAVLREEGPQLSMDLDAWSAISGADDDAALRSASSVLQTLQDVAEYNDRSGLPLTSSLLARAIS